MIKLIVGWRWLYKKKMIGEEGNGNVFQKRRLAPKSRKIRGSWSMEPNTATFEVEEKMLDKDKLFYFEEEGISVMTKK